MNFIETILLLRICFLIRSIQLRVLRMEALKPIQLKKSAVDGPIQNCEEGQPLSPIARLCHQPDSCLYIIVMIGIKTKLDPKVIKADLVQSLLKQPRFCSLLVSNKNMNLNPENIE